MKIFSISAPGIGVTLGRAQVVSYSSAIGRYGNAFFMKNPGDSFNFFVYIKEFTKWAWLVMFFTVLVCLAYFFITER